MKRKVLIVDDEAHIREVTELALDAVGGWDVVAADSGSAAIGKAKVERPDAILMDVMMPDMDGPTTFEKLQSDPETAAIPVILLTAKVQESDRERFAGLGVAGVISKPFDPMSLASQVSHILGWDSPG